jgi:predicted transcriptional regulator
MTKIGQKKYLIRERNILIKKLSEQGMSQADIARIFKIPRNTVCTVLKIKPIKKGPQDRTLYYRNHKREKYKNDIQFKLIVKIRNRIRQVLKGSCSSTIILKDIDCSSMELKNHIEKQFKPGMTWENWGQKGWHIDHIIPLSSFDLTDPDQFKKASNYKNIKPLWYKENLIKSNK